MIRLSVICPDESCSIGVWWDRKLLSVGNEMALYCIKWDGIPRNGRQRPWGAIVERTGLRILSQCWERDLHVWWMLSQGWDGCFYPCKAFSQPWEGVLHVRKPLSQSWDSFLVSAKAKKKKSMKYKRAGDGSWFNNKSDRWDAHVSLLC